MSLTREHSIADVRDRWVSTDGRAHQVHVRYSARASDAKAAEDPLWRFPGAAPVRRVFATARDDAEAAALGRAIEDGFETPRVVGPGTGVTAPRGAPRRCRVPRVRAGVRVRAARAALRSAGCRTRTRRVASRRVRRAA